MLKEKLCGEQSQEFSQLDMCIYMEDRASVFIFFSLPNLAVAIFKMMFALFLSLFFSLWYRVNRYLNVVCYLSFFMSIF